MATKKNSYLIVKTGRAGRKVNDMYNTQIQTPTGPVRLAGVARLSGSWFQQLTRATKARGIQGNLSVFIHDKKTADLLVKESQKSWLMLKDSVEWSVVARLDMTEQELGDISEIAQAKALDYYEQKGMIYDRTPGRYRIKIPESIQRLEYSYLTYTVEQRRYVLGFRTEIKAKAAQIADQILGDKLQILA